jgi:hypothetical protein
MIYNKIKIKKKKLLQTMVKILLKLLIQMNKILINHFTTLNR